MTVDGKRVEMSPKEYELLFYLVRNRNIALDREKLITEVWGYDYYGDDMVFRYPYQTFTEQSG